MEIEYTIIRPLAENEPYLEDCLASSFHMGHYSHECEIYFCCEDIDSEAAQIARKICDRHHNYNCYVISQQSALQLKNPKLNNIAKAWYHAKGKFIIMADSNVFMPEDTIPRLYQAWTKDRVALSCSPPIGIFPGNFAAEVEMAFLNTFQAKWQKLADWLGIGYCQGKVMFVNKWQFGNWGGIAVLDREPAEDAAATKLVRSHGCKIKLVDTFFHQLLGTRTFKQVWNRQLRWAKLRRYTFPYLYSLEIVTTLLPTLIGFYLFPIPTLMCMLIGYEAELLLAKRMNWPKPVVLAMIVRDVMITAIWFAAWFSNNFEWSGNKLRMEPINTTN